MKIMLEYGRIVMASMLPKLKPPVALTVFVTRKYTLAHFRVTLYSHDTSGN